MVKRVPCTRVHPELPQLSPALKAARKSISLQIINETGPQQAGMLQKPNPQLLPKKEALSLGGC